MGLFKCFMSGKAVVLSGNSLNDYINVNTLFYTVVVLALIILIMVITYFAKVKPNLSNNNPGKAAYINSSVDNVMAQITLNEEEEMVNDFELVAVITAAIYASMGNDVPVNGLVVRSIKRAYSKNWKNI